MIFRNRAFIGALVFLCTVIGTSAPGALSFAQGIDPPTGNANDEFSQGGQYGQRLPAVTGIAESTSDVMKRQASAPPPMPHPHFEREVERDDLEENPDAPAVSSYPAGAGESGLLRQRDIHTTSFSFDGPTSNDTGATPPDTMGAAGPTQYINFVNGRIRSYTKAGVADGVLNANPDVFFASVMTPVTGAITQNFTSDPQIRYDRFSARWYMSIIDVPCTSAGCGTVNNRWLLAVSDAASNGTITGATVWTLFDFTPDLTNFCDYPSLGIDVNALYVGCNMFSPAAFVGTNGYVIQKTSVQGAGPIVVTKFATLATGTVSGPYAPRGVDNFDANATVGYFVGSDTVVFSRIVFRRITNPGSAAPTISANINVTVPTTGANLPVNHLGNTGGNNGRLDSLDDRLFAAMIRNDHLWTAHNLRVTSAGIAGTTQGRMAARWYDFANLSTTPTLNQSGTVYDNASTLAAARQYWIPSIAATGQGHAVLGFSLAGTPAGATPAYTGRLAGDTLGTMAGPPSTTAVQIGVTAASYNPSWDTGATNGSRRWGDYSFTMTDPLDDMTIWTVQEYNEATDMYAVRVAKLLAPPPATPTCSSTPVSFTAGTGNVTIGATSSSGSGFYDPGANLPAPARPFNHIGAAMTNGTVNSVTYNSPTSVTLNITANTAGLQSVTITNPDGQNVTAGGCINVAVPTYTIGGNIGGLTGTVQLKVDGTTPTSTQTQSFSANGGFTFTTALQSGSGWTVSVATQPVGQTCSVTSGTGSNLSGNITTVAVSCTTNTYTISGSVTGLTASGLVMAVTAGSQTVTVPSGASSYQFPTAEPYNSLYTVSVQTQPTGQTCAVANPSGTLTATVTNANVTCTTNTYTITGTASPVAGGTVTCTPSSVSYNGSSTCTASANPGYTFSAFSGDCTGATCSLTNIQVDKNVTATFTAITYTITGTASPIAGGTVTCTPSSVSYNGSSTCTASANPGYTFSAFSGDCTGATCSLTNIQADKNVTATFTAITYTITGTASPVAGGTVTCTPSSVSYNGSSTCTASANPGYTFSAFSGDCTGATCALTNIQVNKNVTATFTPITYTITGTASPVAGGTVTCTPSSVSYNGSSTCTASANPGYTFSAFSGDCTGATCALTNIQADKNVTATFTQNTYTIGGNIGGLTGTVQLELDGTTPTSTQTQSFSANGTFTFTTPLQSGSDWTVSVATQPTDQTCSVTNDSGTNLLGDITTVSVSCSTNTYTIGGSVSGLTAPGLVMAVTADSQTVSVASGATSYVFPTAEPTGTDYTVSVQTQPTGQTCTVANATGTVASADVTNADVTCTTNTYTITGTASPVAGGTVTCTPSSVSYNGSSTCTASANPGYTFSAFSGDCTGATCSLTNIQTNKAVTGTFTAITYTITGTASPVAGGTVTCTPSSVSYNGSSTCTASANPGYTFSAFSGDCTGATCSLTNIQANKAVTATFTAITYTITGTASPVAGGTVTCTPSSVSYNGSSTCTASANPGYTFSAFSGDCTGATCSLTNIQVDKNVTATFTAITYTITGTASPVAGGTVTCTPSSVSYNGSSTCTASANPGYTFSAFSGDCTGATCSLTNIQANKNVTATFTAITYTITGTASPVAGGTVTCTPSSVSYNGSSTCTASANPGYTFSAFSGDCTGATCSLTNIQANKNVTATFTAITYTITGTASPVAGGTVTCTPSSVSYNGSSTCTASANPGYTFSAFSGDCTGATCSLTNIQANKAVTATFTAITYTITGTASPVAGGTVTCTPSSVSYNGSSTCTASANPGYTFSAFSGDCTGATCSLTNIQANKAVTATFTAITYTITGTASPVAGGTVTCTPSSVSYNGSSTCTASANPGYTFSAFSGDCTGAICSLTNIQANKAVTATFAIKTYAVTPSVTGNGSISPNTIQTVSFNNTKTFTLSAAAGSHLVNVTGSCGGTLTSNSFTTSAVTANCTVVANFAANPPAKLVFIQQPTNGTAGAALNPAVKVQVQDASGNPVTTDANGVQLNVSGPGLFDPASTTFAAFVNGVATFSNLKFDVMGTGYKLTATDTGDGGLAVDSALFNISAGVPTLVFTIQPANLTQGDLLGTVQVTEKDAFGNVVADNATVDFTITACGGAVDLGSVAMSNGVATLDSTQRFYTPATGSTISAAASSLNTVSTGFNVVAGNVLFSSGFEACRL